MKTGHAVAIKVRHAGIEEIIRRDLDILTGLANWAERVPELSNYRPRATMAEFQRTLRRSLISAVKNATCSSSRICLRPIPRCKFHARIRSCPPRGC